MVFKWATHADQPAEDMYDANTQDVVSRYANI